MHRSRLYALILDAPRDAATAVSRWLDCHVLRAPGGHLLCVIPVASDPELFAATATRWD